MIYIVGIGVGDRDILTLKAKNILQKSDIVIGNIRQLNSIIDLKDSLEFIEYEKISQILDILKEHNGKNISVLASGNPSLYGISDYIIKNNPTNDEINIISGISSISYLFAKEKITMNDVYITSFHSRQLNKKMLEISKKTAFFTDNTTSIYEIAKIYIEFNQNPLFIIGENLSYDNEKITKLYANEITKEHNFKMYVLIALTK